MAEFYRVVSTEEVFKIGLSYIAKPSHCGPKFILINYMLPMNISIESCNLNAELFSLFL